MKVARELLYRVAVSGVPERVMEAVPALEQEGYRQALRYVAGRDREDAFSRVRAVAADGLRASVDLFGEQVTDPVQMTEATDAYVDLAHAVAELPDTTSLSIDLSHIGLDISADLCAENLNRITDAIPVWCRLEVGAEDSTRTDRVLDVALRAAASGARIMQTLQANLRRSPDDATRLIHAEVPVRLVKGAYVESPDVALPWGRETDAAYVALADTLHRAGVELALGTHDAGLREALLLAMPQCEVEMLLGVLPDDANALVARGRAVRLYIPYGPNWARYWMRRLAESQGA
ncbi:MAG: proline dehydrogenase family protein [Candidatus Dormibacteraeota bacterium]|nr:proline dehydrogenase family protein [Candidatus Dormibacteraeota bacterium]